MPGRVQRTAAPPDRAQQRVFGEEVGAGQCGQRPAGADRQPHQIFRDRVQRAGTGRAGRQQLRELAVQILVVVAGPVQPQPHPSAPQQPRRAGSDRPQDDQGVDRELRLGLGGGSVQAHQPGPVGCGLLDTAGLPPVGPVPAGLAFEPVQHPPDRPGGVGPDRGRCPGRRPPARHQVHQHRFELVPVECRGPTLGQHRQPAGPRGHRQRRLHRAVPKRDGPSGSEGNSTASSPGS